MYHLYHNWCSKVCEASCVRQPVHHICVRGKHRSLDACYHTSYLFTVLDVVETFPCDFRKFCFCCAFSWNIDYNV